MTNATDPKKIRTPESRQAHAAKLIAKRERAPADPNNPKIRGEAPKPLSVDARVMNSLKAEADKLGVKYDDKTTAAELKASIELVKPAPKKPEPKPAHKADLHGKHEIKKHHKAE